MKLIFKKYPEKLLMQFNKERLKKKLTGLIIEYDELISRWILHCPPEMISCETCIDFKVCDDARRTQCINSGHNHYIPNKEFVTENLDGVEYENRTENK
ncbi:MAG: hypothetical protein ACTSQY_00845 [Candidatus Odinarchaeia archaeon]